jgi:ABC-type uncharacterized transport system permease subunit
MMPPTFAVTLALYAVACTFFFAHLITGEPLAVAGVPSPRGGVMARAARIALAVAFASQAVDIGWLCVHGLHPGASAREALFFASWLICGAYLATSFRFSLPVVGALVVPAAMVLDMAARLSPSAEAPHAGTLLASLHILLASTGVALFAVAAGGAVVYLLEERNLKSHHVGRLLRRGPALETLDAFNRRCIAVGFPVFTCALVTGAIWVMRLPGSHGLLAPQYLMALITWLLYAVLLVARFTVGWRGRRAALVTLAGFATAMTVFLIYFFRGVTGAAG